jgi:hypothetical protein
MASEKKEEDVGAESCKSPKNDTEIEDKTEHIYEKRLKGLLKLHQIPEELYAGILLSQIEERRLIACA